MIQYTVDNSNNDVVVYWTTTGIHVVPDRQQYIGLQQVHTLHRIDNSMIGTHQLHLANADMIPGVAPDSMIGTHQLHLANANIIPGVNMSY